MAWWCLILLPISAQALNLEDVNPQIFSGPNGSHFGFSLDFYQSAGQGMSIVVGAPKLQTSQPGVIEGGGIFICPWSAKDTKCTALAFDKAGNKNFSQDAVEMMIIKSNQWFGASVRTWKNNIVACAPFQRWSISLSDSTESDVTPTGSCYITGDLKDFREFAPCRGFYTETFLRSISYKQDKRFCELGFSTEITQDGTLVIGAPGGFYFSGLFMLMNLSSILSGHSTSSPVKEYRALQMSPDIISSNDDAFKGFSVAIGEFTDDNSPEIVIGSPNYNSTEGLVEIHSSKRLESNLYSFKGDQVASYFGHAVAVTDVNNDGMDDVLVGAPLYIERMTGGKLQEVGRVYVYLQRRATRFHSKPQIISGSQLYGEFGSSIAPLGDLDQDGFNDVAVGSPSGGKSGAGCVYIYRGGSSGLGPHSQVLESPLATHSRFGFALKGATDIDNNGYPDLLVGAFGSDRVYVFRARPVVVLHTSLRLIPNALNPEEKFCNLPGTSTSVSCFTVHVCMRASGRGLPEKLPFLAELQLDRLKSRFFRRAFFLDSSLPSRTFTVEVQSNSAPACNSSAAFLREESDFKDKLSPILVSVNLSLVSALSSETIQPSLHGTTFLQEQTYIVLDCGEDNLCIPDLHLSASQPVEPLLIGIDNLVQVQFNATNTGEGAYEAELWTWLPAGAHYVHILGDTEEKILCSPKKENETELVVCELGNPMKSQAKIHADLQLSFSNLEDSGSNITFPMQIKSRSSQNSSSPITWVQLAVAVKASLDLRGNSQPAEVILPLSNWEPKEDSKNPRDYGEVVLHVYELHNAGPGSVEVQLTLQSPLSYQEDLFLYPLHLEADKQFICGNQSGVNPLELDIPVVSAVNLNKSSRHRMDRRAVQSIDEREEDTRENRSATDSLERHPVLLNCSGASCWEVQCIFPVLEAGRRATVKLYSVLWVKTFLKRPQEQMTLRSQGSFQVTGVPYKIQPASLLAGDTTTDTQVLWVSPDGQQPIPLWWLIVGILGGLLILTLFICIMWKLGFFQRKRPPQEDEDQLTCD